MKKFLLFFSILYSLSAAAQWEWQNPLPQGNSLDAVHFVDSLEGWAVGMFGTVIQTIDGGVNWDIVSIGTTNDLHDVTFVGHDTGWIVGYQVIYQTVDGGATWFEPEHPPLSGRSVFFINAVEGWIVGGSYQILHTQNGGESWEEQNSGMGSAYGWLYSVFFINENLGWTCSDEGVILKTNDGGDSWFQTNSGTNAALSSIFFINNAVGWATTSYYGIFKSTDGGINWSVINSDVHGSSIYFCDLLNGWICGGSGKVYRTIDGGISWELVPSDASTDLSDLQFVNSTSGFIVSMSGEILSYNSELNYWESLSKGFYSWTTDIFFLDEDEGWVAGSRLYHTTDGGSTWQEQSPAPDAQISCVHFEDHLNGWAAGYKEVYHTRDGGENWELQLRLERGYDTTFREIFFTDTIHGWVLDFYGLIFHTKNGGKTWEEQYTGLTVQQNAFYAIDAQTAWIAGGYGWISITTNGENWSPINTGFQYFIGWDIQFIDAQHGWMIDEGTLYTSDGGQHWEQISNIYGYAIHFINLNQGWLVTAVGKIYHTEDGGHTWEEQNRLTRCTLQNIWFTDENNGWAVGGQGIILHTDNGGTVGTNEFKVQSSKFKMECFPNPLSSVTTIRYDLPRDSFVSLEIFDNVGQQVDDLVNGKQLQGKHEVKWNAENLPTGIYFYRISTYDQSTTGKLVVVK